MRVLKVLAVVLLLLAIGVLARYVATAPEGPTPGSASADRLRPETDASRVRIKAGHHQVMDGPFAETKEALGGFYLIECDSREEAVEWAKKIPLGEGGFVDVRPVWPM